MEKATGDVTQLVIAEEPDIGTTVQIALTLYDFAGCIAIYLGMFAVKHL